MTALAAANSDFNVFIESSHSAVCVSSADSATAIQPNPNRRPIKKAAVSTFAFVSITVGDWPGVGHCSDLPPSGLVAAVVVYRIVKDQVVKVWGSRLGLSLPFYLYYTKLNNKGQ